MDPSGLEPSGFRWLGQLWTYGLDLKDPQVEPLWALWLGRAPMGSCGLKPLNPYGFLWLASLWAPMAWTSMVSYGLDLYGFCPYGLDLYGSYGLDPYAYMWPGPHITGHYRTIGDSFRG